MDTSKTKSDTSAKIIFYGKPNANALAMKYSGSVYLMAAWPNPIRHLILWKQYKRISVSDMQFVSIIQAHLR